MKITGIEKGMLIGIGVCIILLCFTIGSCMHEMQTIEKKGLKAVVNEVWEGK